jgi:hypothetical protein
MHPATCNAQNKSTGKAVETNWKQKENIYYAVPLVAAPEGRGADGVDAMA